MGRSKRGGKDKDKRGIRSVSVGPRGGRYQHALHRERGLSLRRVKSAHGVLDTDRDGVELYECGICLEEFTFAVSLRECR